MECIEILGGYCVEHLQKFIPSSSMTDHEFFQIPTEVFIHSWVRGAIPVRDLWVYKLVNTVSERVQYPLERKAKSRLVAHSLVLGIFDKETFVFAFLETSVS
jgi:hypothetical protein